MSKITIYKNFSGLIDSDEVDEEIQSIADYVPVYCSILESLRIDKDLKVSISQEGRACAAWLRNTAKKWSEERFVFVEVTYKEQLARKWGVRIPGSVTDRQIKRSNLLDLEVEIHPGDSFEDIILRNLFTPHLLYETIPFHLFDKLITDLLEVEKPEREYSRLQLSILRKRLGKWRESARKKQEETLVKWLEEDVRELSKTIRKYQVLKNYPPDVGKRVLEDKYDILSSLPIQLSNIDLAGDVTQDVRDQIRVYLQIKIQHEGNVELIEKLLTQVSGYLELEFNIIKQLVTNNDVQITQNLVEQIISKFQPLRDQLEDDLLDLALLIPPNYPTQPNPEEGWRIEQWLDWVLKEFFPYRFWMEETNQYKKEVIEYGWDFGDWLYEHYNDLRARYPRMLYRALSNLKNRGLFDDESPTLIIIIDNFNYKFHDYLKSLFEEAGFYQSQSEPYIAMLPTCTEVSKKCFVTGKIKPFEGTAYKEPIRTNLGDLLSTERIHYLPYLGSLNGIDECNHDYYVLNFNKIDEDLHKSERVLGISYSKIIRRHLNDLVDAIKAFSQRIDIANDLTVVISSDHGSTKITSDYVNPIDQTFYKDRLEDTHHRFISISENDWKALPENVSAECYRFSKDLYDLNTNYLVAKGYGHFERYAEDTYSHGGLTPEEAIIPLSVFEPVIEEPQHLQFRLLEDEYRYGTKTSIPLEIINTNPYDFKNIQVSIINENISVEQPIQIDQIKADSIKRIDIPARFQKTREAIRSLRIRSSSDILQKELQQTYEFPINIRSIMETRFNLEDLDGEF